MGALYHLKQKLVDFCNVIQENVSRTDTVPSSKVVYDLKADSDSQISDLNDSLTNIISGIISPIDSIISDVGVMTATFADNWTRAVVTVWNDTFRCETTIYRSDVTDNSNYYHYIGGYLSSGNAFGASVIFKPTSINVAGVYKNGTNVTSSSRFILRLFKY